MNKAESLSAERRSRTINEYIPTPIVGEVIVEEFMKSLGISTAVLADNLGLSVTYTRTLLDGELKVTPELSKRLADCFDMSELFFFRLQQDIDSCIISLPRMSEYLLGDFMTPMGLTAQDVSEGLRIPLREVKAMLSDEQEVTPEISRKSGTYFGVSEMLFFDIQNELKESAGLRELRYT